MYEDANGIQHENYDAACEYYGCDSPAQLAAWAEMDAQEEREAEMDDMIARGTSAPFRATASFDDIPF